MPTNEPIGMFDLVNLIMKKLFSKSEPCIFWIYDDLMFRLVSKPLEIWPEKFFANKQKVAKI